MKAEVGDQITIDGSHQGDLPKKGEVLEVREHGDVRHYRVRWDDGHEGLYYPANGFHSMHPGSPRPAVA
jgi:hypothetical protein